MIRRKATALLISVVLCFGLVPAEAFASVGEAFSAPAVIVGVDDASSVGDDLSAESPRANETDGQGQAVQNADGAQLRSDDSADMNVNDLIEYVYIDKSVLALGEEQNIVVALRDESGDISDAVLTLRDSKGTECHLNAVAYANSAVRFSFTYSDNGQALSYTLISLSWTDGSARQKTLDLSGGVDGDCYEFDYVEEGTADALASGDGEVSAAVIDENGQL